MVMRIRSIRHKLLLIILASTFLALSVAGAAMMVYELHAYRNSLIEELTVQAEILGLASAPALEFNDQQVAYENLSLLKVKKEIVSAAIYSGDGLIFASYVQAGGLERALPVHPGKSDGITIGDQSLTLFKSIRANGQTLGMVYIKAQYDWRDRVFNYLQILGTVMLGSLMVSLVLSAWLQAAITKPIIAISNVARDVMTQRNFNLRAERITDDEIGYLVNAFNNMLAEIAQRAGELERSNRALEREIGERMHAETALSISERRHRALVDAMSSVLWIADADGYFPPDQPSWATYTGQTVARYVGLGWRDAFHEEDRALIEQAWRDAIKAKSNLEIEVRLWHAAAQRFHFCSMRAVPLIDENAAICEWIGSLTDIDARKRAEEDLRAADRRKDEFLAMLAHELRNPLAPIRNAAQILSLIRSEEPMIYKASEIIARQVKHMTGLVDDLLDVSRVTRGLVKLESKPLLLHAAIDSAVEQTRSAIELHGHELIVEQPDQPIRIMGDQTRLTQVISNILGNAAKYTPDGGRVTVRVSASTDFATVSIADTGIGMESELLPYVFEPFVQGKRSPDRAQGGLGLGLALAKCIVELHTGSIAVYSAGEGKGSEFIIRLPRIADVEHGTETTKDSAYPSPLNRLSIMIVDDNVDAAQTLAMLMQAEGHDVKVAYEAESMLACAELDSRRVFLLDIGLPGMDGYELARRLRARPATTEAILIAVTGYGKPEDRERSKAAGFDHHLVKPVDPAQLSSILASIR